MGARFSVLRLKNVTPCNIHKKNPNLMKIQKIYVTKPILVTFDLFSAHKEVKLKSSTISNPQLINNSTAFHAILSTQHIAILCCV